MNTRLLRRFAMLTVLAGVFARGATACDSDEPATSSRSANADGGDDGTIGGGGDGSSTGDDGSSAVDAGPPPPPTYCNGIILYASFDTSLVPERGTKTITSLGSATVVGSGHFGGSASLINDAGFDSASTFFQQEDGGPEVYSQQEGTMAFWFRRVLPQGNIVAFVRQSAVNPPLARAAGLTLSRANNTFGLYEELGGQPVLVFNANVVRQFLRDTEFDHYAHAWRKGTDAGQNFLAMLALNGGSGTIFGDAGLDAALYADAQPDDAGNVRIPYRGVSTRPWGPYDPLLAVRIGGTFATAPQGEMDDLAIWNRVLSFEEIAELYARTESIGVTCKIQ
jgi:hypothetical protein